MFAKRKLLALSAALAIAASHSALAGGVDAGALKSCEVLRDKCLARAEKETQNAVKQKATPDPVLASSGVCYSDYDKAKATGVWPKSGPFLARHCSNAASSN